MLDKINDDLKNALKSKDSFTLGVLRMLKSSLQMEGIEKKHDLDDNEITTVIKREVKKRNASIEEYTKYNRMDTVESLEKEIEVLSSYLPEELSEEECEKIVDDAILSVNPSSIKEMGKVMKVVNERLEGKNADMSFVSKLVKEKLNK